MRKLSVRSYTFGCRISRITCSYLEIVPTIRQATLHEIKRVIGKPGLQF